MDNSNQPSNKPLCVIMEEAKVEFTKAINQAIVKTQLPAYLAENIILGILADVRAQKTAEILAEITAANKPPAEEE